MAKHKLKRILIQKSEFGDDYKVVLQKRVNKKWKCDNHAIVAPLDIAEETARVWAEKNKCQIRKKRRVNENIR